MITIMKAWLVKLWRVQVTERAFFWMTLIWGLTFWFLYIIAGAGWVAENAR